MTTGYRRPTYRLAFSELDIEARERVVSAFIGMCFTFCNLVGETPKKKRKLRQLVNAQSYLDGNARIR